MISSIAEPVVRPQTQTPPLPSTAASKIAAPIEDRSSSPSESDTVTLSPAAQAALANPADTKASVQPQPGSLSEKFATQASQNTDAAASRFYGLASVLADKTGSYSEAEQLDAYTEFLQMNANSGLASQLPDYASVFTAAFRDSSITARAKVVGAVYNSAAMAATQSEATNSLQGIAQAQFDAASAMSEADREVLFRTSAVTWNFQPKYADQTEWLNDLQAVASGAKPADTSTNFSQNALKAYQLSAVITDTSGKYTQDEQLSAYTAFNRMSVFGELRGGGREVSQLSNQIHESPIAQVVQGAYTKVISAVLAVFDLNSGNNGSRMAKAQYSAVMSLSPFEQKALFEANVNADLLNRSGEYRDINEWFDRLRVWADAPEEQAKEQVKYDPIAAYAKQVAEQSLNSNTYLDQLKLLFGAPSDETTRDGIS